MPERPGNITIRDPGHLLVTEDARRSDRALELRHRLRKYAQSETLTVLVTNVLPRMSIKGKPHVTRDAYGLPNSARSNAIRIADPTASPICERMTLCIPASGPNNGRAVI